MSDRERLDEAIKLYRSIGDQLMSGKSRWSMEQICEMRNGAAADIASHYLETIDDTLLPIGPVVIGDDDVTAGVDSFEDTPLFLLWVRIESLGVVEMVSHHQPTRGQFHRMVEVLRGGVK